MTDREVDILVVGCGAGGMAAALAGKAEGLDVLVVEKSERFGGSTAMSGGGVWAPNAPALRRDGVVDDPDEVVRYLEAIAGDRVTRERLVAYVQEVPRMLAFLESQSDALADGFFFVRGYPDYHPDKGGTTVGRGLWARPIDRRLLGEDLPLLRSPHRLMQLPMGSWMTSADVRDLMAVRWPGLRGKKMLARLAWRIVRARVLGERIATSGQALAIRLWLALREQRVPVWLETPLISLEQDDDGRVSGAIVERAGEPLLIRARAGVILATGGFDHDPELRALHQPEIVDDWSFGSPTNRGDGIRAGRSLGAALDLMEDAWWMPAVPFADGTRIYLIAERQFPCQFIVNGAGVRFTNEAAPYTDFGHAQIEGQRTGVTHIPAWQIFDHRAWTRNIIVGHLPGLPMSKLWKESESVQVAASLEELGGKIGVPPDALVATAERYNRFARAGRDEDFRRGESAYDRFYANPSYDNPCLGPVVRAPFYALAVVPGDLGTKGGLLTDEHARVLREDGSPIAGLYATGNTSASVMGTDYAGPGSTLGPAMTFGYVAARHLARSRVQAPV